MPKTSNAFTKNAGNAPHRTWNIAIIALPSTPSSIRSTPSIVKFVSDAIRLCRLERSSWAEVVNSFTPILAKLPRKLKYKCRTCPCLPTTARGHTWAEGLMRSEQQHSQAGVCDASVEVNHDRTVRQARSSQTQTGTGTGTEFVFIFSIPPEAAQAAQPTCFIVDDNLPPLAPFHLLSRRTVAATAVSCLPVLLPPHLILPSQTAQRS